MAINSILMGQFQILQHKALSSFSPLLYKITMSLVVVHIILFISFDIREFSWWLYQFNFLFVFFPYVLMAKSQLRQFGYKSKTRWNLCFPYSILSLFLVRYVGFIFLAIESSFIFFILVIIIIIDLLVLFTPWLLLYDEMILVQHFFNG